MVGFPDFIYKHIVPACFLAPLKPTFDLADAQTVLVSSWRRHTRAEGAALRDALLCLADAVGVCRHAEDDSSEEGKRRRWWAGGASRLLLIPLSLSAPGPRVHPLPAAGVLTLAAGVSRHLPGNHGNPLLSSAQAHHAGRRLAWKLAWLTCAASCLSCCCSSAFGRETTA